MTADHIPKLSFCPLPKCGSTRIDRHGPDSRLAKAIARAWGNPKPCAIDICMDCKNFWEPWPDDDPGDDLRDNLARDLCDTCAFRRQSREWSDPYRRAELLELVEAAANWWPDAPSQPCFTCHKGVPISLGEGFIAFDFEAIDARPLQRVCAGFIRAVCAREASAI